MHYISQFLELHGVRSIFLPNRAINQWLDKIMPVIVTLEGYTELIVCIKTALAFLCQTFLHQVT